MVDITSIELLVEKKGGRKHHLLSVLVLLSPPPTPCCFLLPCCWIQALEAQRFGQGAVPSFGKWAILKLFTLPLEFSNGLASFYPGALL